MLGKVLVTGGAGYIGSHTLCALLAAGYQPLVVDNLCNSSYEAIRRVEELSGHKIPFYQVDLLDMDGLRKVFAADPHIQAVIHFAGLKAVGESAEKPLDYYRVNVGGTINLLEVMRERGVEHLIYSSSATVYGNPPSVPIWEDFPLAPLSPYGRSKLACEQIIQDVVRSGNLKQATILRYFNPAGAHPSGRLGEDPQGHPNNLMPFLAQVAVGIRPRLSVFGNDYDTPDGTCIRDYIHVMDLAEGHVAALLHPPSGQGQQARIVNLGTGQGQSVLQMVAAFEQAVGRPLPYEIVGRRAGDVPRLVANVKLAWDLWGWQAKRNLADMCTDLWRWQANNPLGFKQRENAFNPPVLLEVESPLVQAK